MKVWGVDDLSPASKAQQRAVAKYENKVYDKYLVRVPKGRKSAIQDAADKVGQSINGYIVQAVDERMQRDGTASEEVSMS